MVNRFLNAIFWQTPPPQLSIGAKNLINGLGIKMELSSADEKTKLNCKYKCDNFSYSCLQGIETSGSGNILSSTVGPALSLVYKHLHLNRTTVALIGLKPIKWGSVCKDKT